jgi:hypothetical protein
MAKDKTQLSPREIKQLAGHIRKWEQSLTRNQSPPNRFFEIYTGRIAGLNIIATVGYSRVNNNGSYSDADYESDAYMPRVSAFAGCYSTEDRIINSAERKDIKETFYLARKAYKGQEEKNNTVQENGKEKVMKKSVACARKLISRKK